MTCLRILLPAPRVPASQMKTPTFEQSTWANARSTRVIFQLCFSDSVYSRWQAVHCLSFGLLLTQKENGNTGMVPILRMLRKKRHWWTKVRLLCLYLMRSLCVTRAVGSVALTVGWLPEWFAHIPSREATSGFTAAGWAECAAPRAKRHLVPVAPPLASHCPIFIYFSKYMYIYSLQKTEPLFCDTRIKRSY